MSQIQQGTGGEQPTSRGRTRLVAASRRAVGYFVDPVGQERSPAVGAREEATAEFTLEAGADARSTPIVLPLTRSGGYEREAVDAHLVELEHELAVARAAASVPTGVEGEIQRLAAETAEILRVAQQKADELVARATLEADAQRLRAQVDADAITRMAEDRLRELDRDTDVIWAERTRLTDDTLRLAAALRQIAEGAVERFPAAVEEAEPASSRTIKPDRPAGAPGLYEPTPAALAEAEGTAPAGD